MFAVLHLFWAAGGKTALASSAGQDLADRRPAVFVLFGLVGVAVLLLAGMLLIGLLARNAGPPRLAATARALVFAAGVALCLRGIGLEVLLSVNAGLRHDVGPLETRWSLVLWNPWFVLGGALFLLTALRTVPERARSSRASITPAAPPSPAPTPARRDNRPA